jgi:hypothetical protein
LTFAQALPENIGEGPLSYAAPSPMTAQEIVRKQREQDALLRSSGYRGA